MPDVDIKVLDVPQLITHARSLGINPQGMRRDEIENEIAAATNPPVPTKENQRILVLEDIIKAISPVIEQLQADMKKVQVCCGIRKEE